MLRFRSRQVSLYHGPSGIKTVRVMFIQGKAVINYQGSLKTSKMRDVSSWYRLNLRGGAGRGGTCHYKRPFSFSPRDSIYDYISAFREARTENSFIKLIWSEYQIKNIEMSGACSTYGGEGRFILVGRPDGRRPLGRPKLRWEDKIKLDLQEVG